MLLQCTKKLLDELKVKPALGAEKEPSFSYHANIVCDGNEKMVVIINDEDESLIKINIEGFDDINIINENIINSVKKHYMNEGCAENFIINSQEIIYTKTSSRSLISKLNYGFKHLSFITEEDNTDIIFVYLRALTNLYGIVPLSKVAEIFNSQNELKIDVKDIENAVSKRSLKKELFILYDNYFVEASIICENSFEELLKQQENKPYYIPEKSELLKYENEFYYQDTEEYKKLKVFIKENFVMDEEKLSIICEDLRFICGGLNFSIDSILGELNGKKIYFKDKKQLYNLISIVMELANNTRIWANRGFAPKETNGSIVGLGKYSLFIKKFKKANKLGRNDLCTCGSGKKYKKCCLQKINQHQHSY